MSSKEKIKKLENLAKQVFQEESKVYFIIKNNDTNKYEYENEVFESETDFKEKKNIPENSLIISIIFV
ncbi:MAG: hypothetical protein NTU73_00415 [Ignavibacteriae bacterium]|nr:hypothetical protein [Ignavibacteriota bacterium]